LTSNPKVIYRGAIRIAEARFFFRTKISGIKETLALCSLYSPADECLHRQTYGALNVFEYNGEDDLVVIRATTILSVVAMVPFGKQIQGHPSQFFLVEKFALGVVDSGDILE
jgi:hypothetical protein